MLLSEKEVFIRRDEVGVISRDEMRTKINALKPTYSSAHETVQNAILSAVKETPRTVHYYQRIYENRSIFSYEIPLSKAKENKEGRFLQVQVQVHQPLSKNVPRLTDMHTMQHLQQLMLKLDYEFPTLHYGAIKRAVGACAIQFGGQNFRLTCTDDTDISAIKLQCDKTRQVAEFSFFH